MIDEFQDTDPMQERIFRRLFNPAEHWIFLIGDPKQAIYSFRGADLQTYLRAAASANRRWSLGVNYRSEPALVEAVNGFFQADSFGCGIEFRPVQSCVPARPPLLIDGAAEPPLQLWISDEKQAAGSADKVICAAVAAETKRLLESDARIDDRRLGPGDIAVLTVNNIQTRQTQDALQRLGIPAVVQSGANVFHSPEALAVSRLVAALAEPRRDGLIRAALATPLFGWSGGEILARTSDETIWSAWKQHFQEWHQQWLAHGFMTMFQEVLRIAGTRERVLGHWGGERTLTNLLHLAELLHCATLDAWSDPSRLVQWLDARMAGVDTNEAWEQRLETDSDAVQILTTHKSKGLEYAVVFVPFAWKGIKAPNKNEPLIFHQNDALFCHLGEEGREQVKARVGEELVAEKMRLLYVAVTRARQRCYLVVKPGNLAGTSALATLFGQDVDTAWLRERFAGQSAIRVIALPAPATGRFQRVDRSTKTLQAAFFAGEISRDWKISSFTALSKNQSSEEPDRDESFALPPVIEPLVGVATLPPGPALGTCLHEILEKIDFQQPDAWPSIVQHALRRAVIHQAEAAGIIWQMLERLVNIPLAPGLTLDQVPPADRLNELEFQLPLGALTPDKLRAACTGAAAPVAWERLNFSQVRGMLKGFVDLVFRHDGRFWLIDWKSNFLAPTASGYDLQTMTAAMRHAQYGLQYLLYCVALRRFLRERVAGFAWERDFGGVFYVFLRGVDPVAPRQGIFVDRPPETLIAALDALFV